MGKITNALKKAAEERLQRIEKINKIKEYDQIIVKKMGSSRVDPRIVERAVVDDELGAERRAAIEPDGL